MTTEWTLAAVQAALNPIAAAHGKSARAFLINGRAVRIEVSSQPGIVSMHDWDRFGVTCWTEISAKLLDAVDVEPGGVAMLVERELAELLRLRHGGGAAA
ncbi:MAG TPA: hypothetical protein VFQ42_22220 [Mycobacterium sp.]|nr:hypothetical protein [Mycobacterium sp.]